MNTLIVATDLALVALRGLLLVVALAAAVAVGLSWAVRTRRLSAFGAPARFVRRRVDPLFAPVERRLLTSGGQPAHAPWWTLAAVVVSGIVVLSLLGFLRDQLLGAALALQAGPRGLYVLLVTWGVGLLQLALMVRVISSWVPRAAHSRWTAWSFTLTEWFLRPLRQVIPNLGMIDITPIVAYFALVLVRGVLLSLA